jgi:protein-tyrosine phosphatase
MPFSFLKSKKRTTSNSIEPSMIAVDVHAHVLSGLDNGPNTLDEAIAMLRLMSVGGIKKIIATPHIMGDFYKNTADSILASKNILQNEIQKKGINIILEVAAEYYLDVSLMAAIESDKRLLTFGNDLLLFETNMVGKPPILLDAVSLMIRSHYVPVLAHPERYHYLQQNFDLVEELFRRGVLFQINISSLTTTHRPTYQLANLMVERGMCAYLGSNLHHVREWPQIEEAIKSKEYAKAIEMGIKNLSLL